MRNQIQKKKNEFNNYNINNNNNNNNIICFHKDCLFFHCSHGNLVIYFGALLSARSSLVPGIRCQKYQDCARANVGPDGGGFGKNQRWSGRFHRENG